MEKRQFDKIVCNKENRTLKPKMRKSLDQQNNLANKMVNFEENVVHEKTFCQMIP